MNLRDDPEGVIQALVEVEGAEWLERPKAGTPLEIGRGRIVREGTSIALLSFGTRLGECEGILACKRLRERFQ